MQHRKSVTNHPVLLEWNSKKCKFKCYQKCVPVDYIDGIIICLYDRFRSKQCHFDQIWPKNCMHTWIWYFWDSPNSHYFSQALYLLTTWMSYETIDKLHHLLHMPQFRIIEVSEEWDSFENIRQMKQLGKGNKSGTWWKMNTRQFEINEVNKTSHNKDSIPPFVAKDYYQHIIWWCCQFSNQTSMNELLVICIFFYILKSYLCIFISPLSIPFVFLH